METHDTHIHKSCWRANGTKKTKTKTLSPRRQQQQQQQQAATSSSSSKQQQQQAAASSSKQQQRQRRRKIITCEILTRTGGRASETHACLNAVALKEFFSTSNRMWWTWLGIQLARASTLPSNLTRGGEAY